MSFLFLQNVSVIYLDLLIRLVILMEIVPVKRRQMEKALSEVQNVTNVFQPSMVSPSVNVSKIHEFQKVYSKL